MKRKALGFIAMAMAFIANTAFAYNGVGDIVSIDPCDQYGIKQPVNTTPKAAGETAYFRIRLLNVNCRMSYDTRDSSKRTSPWEPDYNGLTVGSGVMEQMWLANPPKIGVYVSGQLRGATIGYPYAVTMDDDGSWAGWYTDLVCSYTVKPGDLALPMTLANAAGKEVGNGASATYYFNTIPASSVWRLRADERAGTSDDAEWNTVVSTNYCQFSINMGSVDLPPLYVAGQDWTQGDVNLKQAGLYLKSVDFHATDYTVSKGRTEKVTVDILGGANTNGNGTVYVMTKDLDAIELAENEVETVTITSTPAHDTDGTYQVAKVTIPSGVDATDFSFKVKGVETNKTGTVYLSTTKEFTYGDSGDLVTNFVTAAVMCVAPPPPYITVTIDEAASKSVTAGSNYTDYAAKLTVALSEAYSNDFTVVVTPSMVSASGTDPLGKYIGMSSYSENGFMQRATNVTFTAVEMANGTLSKDLYLYALGADDDTDGVGKGIVFNAAAVAPADEYFNNENPSAILYIKKSTPVITYPEESHEYSGLAGGVESVFSITVADDYTDLQSPYTVQWYKTGSGAANTFVVTPNADGELAVSVKYNSGSYTSRFRVQNAAGVWSEMRKVTVQVNEAKQVTAVVEDPDDSLNYDEDVEELSIRFKLTEGYEDGTLYAFLVPLDEASSNLVTCKQFTQGVAIRSGDTESAGVARMIILDGNDETQPLTYGIMLRTRNTLTTGELIGTYESKDLEIFINNKAPAVTEVKMSGSAPVTVNGDTFRGKASLGLNKIFTIEADDVEADLTANVISEWTFSDPNGNAVTRTVTAPLDDIVLTNVFEVAGTYDCTVKLRDKDMSASDFRKAAAFTFHVTVLDTPSVNIVFPESDTFNETDVLNRKGFFYIELSTAATKELDVAVTVAQNGADGVFSLVTNSVHFRAGQTRQRIDIADLDGTDESVSARGGFTITAAVTTETPNEDGIALKDVYLPATERVFVMNENPTITRPIFTGETNSAAINVNIPIPWKVSDINYDLTDDLLIEWTTSEGRTATFRGSDVSSGVFTNMFTSGGSKSVTLTVTDKDGGSSSVTLYYRVAASKSANIYPQGPYYGGGLSPIAKKYVQAYGRGEGRVWSNGGSSLVEDFMHRYTYDAGAIDVDIYAWGYKNGQTDDGTLTDVTGTAGRDIAITPYGFSFPMGTVFTADDCYTYTDRNGRDSFFYAWIIETKEEEAVSYTGSALVSPQSPNFANRFSRYTLTLPTELSGDDTRPVYAGRYLEAFFSRELYVADNMGDMNGDGIPDYFATLDWSMDSGESKPICEAMTGQAISTEGGEEGGSATASDLTDVSSFNDDNDFMPACWGYSANPLKPALPDWGPGEKFTALYEIRGIGMAGSDRHLGLNEPGVSDYDLSQAETYALMADFVAVGNTLTGVEADDYAAATNWATSVRWTPEAINANTGARLNPLKADTDGDGFDDGWEYFFWYHARIGAVTNGVWGRLEGRRYDIAAPATGTRISPEEIAEAFDPHRPAVGGRDFDGDGLTDLEEYALGTNPCDWDSDGDGMNDLWEVMNGLDPLSPLDAIENPDRDFMALSEYAADTFTVFTFANGDMFGLPTATSPSVELEPITSGVSTNGFLVGVDNNGATNLYIVAAQTAVGALSDDLEALPAIVSGDTTYLAGLTPVTLASGTEIVFAADAEGEYPLMSAFYGAEVYGSGAKIWFAEQPKLVVQYASGLVQLAKDSDGFETFTYGGTDYLGASRTFPAGTLLKSVAAEPVNMNQVYVSPYMKDSGGFVWTSPKTLEKESTVLALPLFNYGGDGSTYVPAALTVDQYCVAPVTPDRELANAFGVTLPEGFVRSQLVKVETNRKLTLIHNQVLSQYGFDPRVAWTIDDYGYVDQRWRKVDSAEADEGLGATGLATNTVAYTSRDEYLVMQYRQQMRKIGDDGLRSTTESLLNGGEIYLIGADTTASTGAAVSPNASVPYFRLATTYPNFPVEFVRQAYAERNEISPFENSTNRLILAYWTWLEVDNDIHGADTDQDGIPDGWELYINADPNNYDDGKLSDGWAKDGDELNLLEEYAGVDSCNAYTNRFLYSDPTKLVYPEADTITKNHPGRKSGWWNKFFPTNPYDMDTDGDGVMDHAEGRSFVTDFYVGNNWYGSKATSFIYGQDVFAEKYDMDGSTTCFRGGGLNPCTVDTDGDLLPDAWEFQFAGIVFKDGAPEKDITLRDSDLQILTMADGKQKAVSASGSEIRGGMDGTWKGDACFDFDHDGLVNCQEYLVQSLRHLRYDDDKTPLMGIDPNSRQFLKFIPFSAWDGEFFHKKCLESGFTGLGTWQFRDLGYFARPPHDWDMLAQNPTGIKRCANYEAYEGAGYRVMLPPIVELPLIGPYRLYVNGGMQYACTDPRRWDTDEDGMDDYYELFHGLNPLLGTIANPLGNDDYGWVNTRYDVIAQIHNAGVTAWSNFWTGWNMDEPPPFDAMRYPWTIGTMECDADGDGLRNDEEALRVNLAKPTNTHTDPTPLWMTDSTSTDHASFTSQYYAFDPYITQSADFDPNIQYPDVLAFPWDDMTWFWRYRSPGASNESREWMFSFEENEGYDTDHDFKSDAKELVLGVEPASEPQLFADPNRRQALYFPGEDSAAMSRDGQGRRAVSSEPDLFKQFTVECWVKPEELREAVFVERICNYGPSTLSNNTSVLRANFRIGMDADGRAYGEFEGSTANSGHVLVTAPTALPPETWTHIAFTFNGTDAKLFLDGNLAPVAVANGVGLIPANGIYGIQQEYFTPVMDFGYIALPCATVLGASVTDGNALALDENSDWSQLGSFFKGWLDEVRVWDGARTPEEIHTSYRKRFTMDDLKQLRSNDEQTGVFDQWVQGVRRSGITGLTLPAELIQHYNFVNLPGGIEPCNVMTEPSEFQANVLDNVRKPNGRTLDGSLMAGWWSRTPLHSTVYWNYAVVPWIGNMAAHMPYMDGSSPDSQYWSANIAGVIPATSQGLIAYDYPNEANPYPYFLYHRERNNRWNLLSAVENLNTTNSTSSASNYLGTVLSADSIAAKWMFQLRSELVGTSDLVPLGGAYAKRGTDFWDGRGAMDAWAETSKEGEIADTNGNGIPDWAEKLWETDGEMTLTEAELREAYLRALAKGLLPTAASAADFAEAYASVIDDNFDGVPDWWQKMYGVSGSAQVDTDKDGLADFAEYLVSEVFDFDGDDNISPVRPKSNGKEFDYFRKVGKLYLGEMFSDHDFMEDHLEREYSEVGADSGIYDANLDSDEDGWSNWAEIRAKYAMGYEVNATGQMKTNTVYDSYVYYDWYKERLDDFLADKSGEIIILDTDFNISGNGYWYDGMWFNEFYGSGYIKYNKLTPIYSKTYTYKGQPEPQVAMTVRYNGVKDLTGVGLTVQAYTDEELKRPDAVFTVVNGDNRNVNTLAFKVPADGYLREGKNTFVVSVGAASNVTAAASIMGIARNVDVGWTKVAFDVELTEQNPICPRPTVATDTNGAARVYVYRYTVDNEPAPAILSNRLVLEKAIGDRSFIHEGDFLSDTEFDIDWANFQREVVRNGYVLDENFPVTSVTYRVYFKPTDVRSSAVQTNAVEYPFVPITRVFGVTRATAVPVAPGADSTILYSARPTFRWRMEGDQPDSFTAFAIQVKDASGAVVWNSGKRIAPPRNIYGEYEWEAPLYAGDQTPLGKVFASTNNYTWAVSMYNSKYQSDSWSEGHMFRVNVYAEDEINNAGRYGITTAVKYFGPGSVNTDVTKTNAILRVEAYTSPDFSGEPEGRTFVRDFASVTNADHTVNATIAGLKAGTYYVRAFIDSDGDFRRSAWESWGYACPRGDTEKGAIYAPTSVTVGDGVQDSVVSVYVEDCDVDQDCLPDVWEYDNAGTDKTDFLLKKGPMENTSNGYIEINPNLQSAIADLINAPGSSKPKLLAARPGMVSSDVVALALGVPSLEPTLDEDTLAIKSLALDNGEVTLTLGAEAEDPTVGTVFVSKGVITATLVVKYADSLGGEWNSVEVPFEKKVKDGAVSETITFSLSELGLDASKGFFKIELKQ